MKETYAKFFRNLEECADDFFKLPTSTAHDLTIENGGLKVTMELTDELMKELISKCVYIYGLEAVVKSAVEAANETDAE
jgi:hypothetical protein